MKKINVKQKKRNKDAALIKKIIREISGKKGIEAVYLFGSYAKGNPTPMSDIDICVISRHISEEEKRAILSNASRKVDIVLFDDLPFGIRWRVLNEGKPLYVKEKKNIEYLKWRAFKDYMDFKPIIRRRLQDILPGVKHG